jgi:hypothetical protein
MIVWQFRSGRIGRLKDRMLGPKKGITIKELKGKMYSGGWQGLRMEKFLHQEFQNNGLDL